MKYSLRFSSLAILLLFLVFATAPALTKELTRAYESRDSGSGDSRAVKSTSPQSGEHPGSQHDTKSVGEMMLQNNPHIAPYMPSDTHAVNNKISTRCDENGSHDATYVMGRCLDYASASTRTKWRVRFGPIGNGAQKIFKMQQSGYVLHAEFDSTDAHKVIFTSTEAQKYSASNGNQATSGGKRSTLPQQEQAQQAQQAPMQQPRTDCERFSGLSQIPQRIACEAISRK